MLAFMTKSGLAVRPRERLPTPPGGGGARPRPRPAPRAGEGRVTGEPVTKPATLVAPTARVDLLKPPAYVSRGGEKLAHALAEFRIDVRGWTCVDIGASTGGFTDCLLQKGARRIYAVDVGYGQLDYRVRQDDRVLVMERTNARDLPPLPEACDLATVDVAFIGVGKVIPAVARSLRPGGQLGGAGE